MCLILLFVVLISPTLALQDVPLLWYFSLPSDDVYQLCVLTNSISFIQLWVPRLPGNNLSKVIPQTSS